MTWIIYTLIAATLISVAAILAKLGSKKADPSLGAGLCILVVCVGAFILLNGNVKISGILSMGRNSTIFLILDGLTTGAALICFFKAIHTGEVSNIAPVIKLNIIFIILFGVLYWHNRPGTNQIAAIVLCVAGIVVMLVGNNKGWQWCGYALLSAVFLTASSILESIGASSPGGASLRFYKLFIAAILIWVVAFATGSGRKLRAISFLDGIYNCLSGVAIVLNWICLDRAHALKGGMEVEQIYRIDLLILVILASMILKEKISGRKLIGAVIFIAGLEVLLLAKPIF